MEQIWDILIIGGGPAGLSAGINAAARGKRALILTAGESYLAKAEQVNNHLGLHSVTGKEMMKDFTEQALQAGVEIRKGKVGNVMPFDGRFMVNCDGDILESKALILAIGAARSKPLPGELELLGGGVSYCATCDGMLYRGRRAIVTGSSQNLVEEANFLQGIGVQVTLVTPKPRPEALHADAQYHKGVVTALTQQDGRLTGVQVLQEQLPADVVFLLRDAISPATLVPGLAMEEGSIQVNRWMETNLPGLFACGDCTGEPLQVSKAVGEGLIAAQRAAQYLDK
ncbi:MAG: NAD(P)/FAD-dependent oxidoreductase [Eubacteriales bacterium]|jgi:thioredoxin reductase (NADPH)